MDPPSPIQRDLAQEEILEDIIHNAPGADPPESPTNGVKPILLAWYCDNLAPQIFVELIHQY